MEIIQVLFLDLDGTVREPISENKFINDPFDQKLIEGVDKAIAHYEGWHVIGITNQGGCDVVNSKTGLPLKSMEDCIAEQKRTLELLPQLECIYFCPSMTGQTCWFVSQEEIGELGSIKLKGKFRKPDPGMLTYALWNYSGVELSNCLMVGDRPEDEGAAIAMGIPFMWANDWRENQSTPTQG